MLNEKNGFDIRKISKDAQIIIGRLISASKNLKLYPASHPIAKRIISNSYAKLNETLREMELLSLSLAGNVLLINDKPAYVTNKQLIDTFLTILGRRKIGKITFIKGIDMDEFSGFAEILGFDPDDIEKKGGVKRLLSEKNIHHITVSGLSFGEEETKKETGIQWQDLLSLITGSDDFLQRVEKNPAEFSRVMEKTLGEPGREVGGGTEGIGTGEGTGGGTGGGTTTTGIGTGTGGGIGTGIGTGTGEGTGGGTGGDMGGGTGGGVGGGIGAGVGAGTGEGTGGGTGGGMGGGVGGGIGAGVGAGTGGGTGAATGIGGGGWGAKVKQAVGNIAERLFNMYGSQNPDGYVKTVSKLILVLTPKMQSEILFAKPDIPYWDKVVDDVVDNITRTELADLVAEETKKSSETMVITGEESEGKNKLSNINSFLASVVDRNKRKNELIPAISKSLQKRNVKQSMLEYMVGGKTKKELFSVIENDLMKTGIDKDALLTIKTLVQKNASIEEFLKSLIDMLNNKKPETRKSVVDSFVDLADKLLLLGRLDLLKLIIVSLSNRLGKEPEKTIFAGIVNALSIIASKLIKEGKGLIAETIDNIINNYLRILDDEEKLKVVIKALSKISDQQALKHLIYAINRDVAYNLIADELVKKGEAILPHLLRGMKTIEDRITRIRVLSLLIDTSKRIPNVTKFLATYIDDTKWYVRRNIAITLGEIGNEKAFQLLSKMVKDREPRVRLEVVQSLGKAKSEDSELLLIETLKDDNKDVLVRTLTSLRKVGTEMSVFALKELLEKQMLFQKEKMLEIKERAIVVLTSIGGREVEDILRKVIFTKSLIGRYKYSDKIRLLAVQGLDKLDTKSASIIISRAAKLTKDKVGKEAEEIQKRHTIL